jgi:transcriptional regulator with GAF, ATPase, and Fis domain
MSASNETVPVSLHCHSGENHLPRARIVNFLAREGVSCHPSGKNSGTAFGLVLFDKENPELIDVVQNCSQQGFDRVLVVAVHKAALTGGTPWKLMQAGASDVVAWDSIEDPAASIAARLQRWKAVDDLVNSALVRDNLVGRSRAWVCVLRQVIEMACFTDASVLITGESGTGKELIARLIHTLDTRSDKRDLVVLDCTTVVPELSGSEFFGHERGAFTHAVASRDGAFALADGGSLFLDEVGELPLTLQAELLRIVQERTYKRIGSNAWKNVNFRLICATNRNLEEEKARGAFRLDFYHRIASWTCKLPSLNERREDIIPLTQYFLRQLNPEGNAPELDSAVRDYLLLRNYPGNVRDLRQLVSRMAKRHVGHGPISVGDIPEDESPFAAHLTRSDWRDKGLQTAIRHALTLGVTLKQISNGATELAIRIALENEEGNLQQAARRLGVTDRALQMRRAADRQRGRGIEEMEPRRDRAE